MPDVTPLTILVVEDDSELCEVIAELLSQNGYRTRTARQGAEALAILQSAQPIGLVLLDLGLPDMDGWQVASAVLEIPDRRTTPILAFTASVPTSVLPPPFVGFVPKPVPAESLLKQVRLAVGISGRRAPVQR